MAILSNRRPLARISRHGTCTAGTVVEVELDARYSTVEVINRTGDDEIYFTVDGVDPEVEGDDTHVLPATMCAQTVVARPTENTVVKLISNGTPKYTVRGIR